MCAYPMTFVRYTVSQSESSSFQSSSFRAWALSSPFSTSLVPKLTPALLTSTSTCFSFLLISLKRCSIDALSVMSAGTGMSWPRGWRSDLPHAFVVCSRTSGRRPVMYTRAPLLANACAIMRPMPVPPPVTTQTQPSTSKRRDDANFAFPDAMDALERVVIVVDSARVG